MDPVEVLQAELVEGLARMVNHVIQHGKAETRSALDQIEVIRTHARGRGKYRRLP